MLSLNGPLCRAIKITSPLLKKIKCFLFCLWIIRFPTNHHPQSLDTEKSCYRSFSKVQTISQGKERDEKRKDVCYWQEGLEKGTGSQWAAESWDPWWSPGLVLFFRVMLTWDRAMMPLSAHSPVTLSVPLSFLEKQLEELLHQGQIALLSFQPSAPCT